MKDTMQEKANHSERLYQAMYDAEGVSLFDASIASLRLLRHLEQGGELPRQLEDEIPHIGAEEVLESLKCECEINIEEYAKYLSNPKTLNTEHIREVVQKCRELLETGDVTSASKFIQDLRASLQKSQELRNHTFGHITIETVGGKISAADPSIDELIAFVEEFEEEILDEAKRRIGPK